MYDTIYKTPPSLGGDAKKIIKYRKKILDKGVIIWYNVEGTPLRGAAKKIIKYWEKNT